jgi:hypothetical protein
VSGPEPIYDPSDEEVDAARRAAFIALRHATRGWFLVTDRSDGAMEYSAMSNDPKRGALMLAEAQMRATTALFAYVRDADPSTITQLRDSLRQHLDDTARADDQ